MQKDKNSPRIVKNQAFVRYTQHYLQFEPKYMHKLKTTLSQRRLPSDSYCNNDKVCYFVSEAFHSQQVNCLKSVISALFPMFWQSYTLFQRSTCSNPSGNHRSLDFLLWLLLATSIIVEIHPKTCFVQGTMVEYMEAQ